MGFYHAKEKPVFLENRFLNTLKKTGILTEWLGTSCLRGAQIKACLIRALAKSITATTITIHATTVPAL